MVCVFIMNRMNSQSSGFTQRRRLALGIVILLLVDVIWVASSELTSVCTSCSLLVASHENNIVSVNPQSLQPFLYCLLKTVFLNIEQSFFSFIMD